MRVSILILTFLCQCVLIGAIGKIILSPPIQTSKAASYYCGICCGYKINCPPKKTPFLMQDRHENEYNDQENHINAIKQDSEADPYFCFSCCGRDWYCNQ